MFFSIKGLSSDYIRKLDSFVDSLNRINVKTIVIYYDRVVGEMPFDWDSVSYTDTSQARVKYLFWIQDSNKYLLKFDIWNDYLKIKLDTSRFLDLLLKNLNKVRDESIKPIAFGDLYLATFTKTISVIEIKTASIAIKKYIDHFDLETEYFNSTNKNINYVYNQNTILKKLKDTFESEIKIYDNSNRFIIK